jgi:hypothetical protein
VRNDHPPLMCCAELPVDIVAIPKAEVLIGTGRSGEPGEPGGMAEHDVLKRTGRRAGPRRPVRLRLAAAQELTHPARERGSWLRS